MFVIKTLVKDAMQKRLVERFRSEHPDLSPTETSNRTAAEFLDQCAVIFQCTACESVYHFKDAGAHSDRFGLYAGVDRFRECDRLVIVLTSLSQGNPDGQGDCDYIARADAE